MKSIYVHKQKATKVLNIVLDKNMSTTLFSMMAVETGWRFTDVGPCRGTSFAENSQRTNRDGCCVISLNSAKKHMFMFVLPLDLFFSWKDVFFMFKYQHLNTQINTTYQGPCLTVSLSLFAVIKWPLTGIWPCILMSKMSNIFVVWYHILGNILEKNKQQFCIKRLKTDTK